MKVMVTGAQGQLGYDIVRHLEQRGIDHRGVDLADFDIADKEAVLQAVASYDPTHIVHCAAYTAVDKAEEEKELCTQVNVVGTKNMLEAARAVDAELMYFSTDYVFDGMSKKTPWEVEDAKKPINHYGLTKYQGEQLVEQWTKHYILRISWVFGMHGANFVKTMLRLAENHDELTVVDDQFGAPTYTYDVAGLAIEILLSQKYGTYHTPNSGSTSWHQFAQEIFKQSGVDVNVLPIASKDYPTAAKRPHNSRLSLRSLSGRGFGLLPDYKDALTRYLKEIDQ